MAIEDFGEYLHIDVSGSLHKSKKTGIACVSANNSFHIGLTISKRLKQELRRYLKVQNDYAQLYAISIYHLLSKVDLKSYRGLVICKDAPYDSVMIHLNRLFEGNQDYAKLVKYNIAELRSILGIPTYKSKADNRANSYRKRGLTHNRQDIGIPLCPIPINFISIKKCWKE